MAILHIAVAAVCFIGALIFFNGRISMEKGSAVAELANPSYPVLEIGNDTSSYNLMAGYKEDIDLSLVRNQITLTNNKNAVILKLHDYDYDITAIQYTLFEKTPDKPTETGTLNQLTKNKKKKGCFVSRNTLYDVLTNPFYHGLMCIKGEFYNHIYEPLISKELFDRVQAILTGNGNHNRNNTTEYAKTPYTFRGLIHCKECGCLITPEKKVKKNGNTYIYLRCGHPCKECHQGIVNENVIIEQLKKEVMDKISLPPKLQEIVKEKLTQELNDTSAFNKTMKTNITKQLNELKVKDDNLLDYYLEGGLPKETYEEKHKQITNQRAELEQTAERYKNIDADMKKRVVQVMALANNISKLFDMATPTRRNELLQLLISNCQLNGSKLEYTINAPFNWLVDSNNYTEWTSVVIQHLDDFECVKV